MVTATETPLAWDAFLSEDYQSEGMREQVTRWMRTDWKELRRNLALSGWVVTVDPHWHSPGSCVYWSEQTHFDRETNQRVGDGVWTPTRPLPANTVSLIAAYLKKGFRFRPPLEGVEADVFFSVEPAILLEAQGKDIGQQSSRLPQFWCARHGSGRYGFASWQMYLDHCNRRMEAVEEKAPPEVLKRLSEAAYACLQHNKTFPNDAMAKDHYRRSMRRPGRAQHVTIEQMRNLPAASGDRRP